MLDHDFHAVDNGPAHVPSQVGGYDTVTSADTAETPNAPGDQKIIPDARMDAFIAISGERDYQDANYPEDIFDVNVGDTLLLIEEFLGRAKDARVQDDGAAVAHNVRKIAAIAVRAMEVLGVATRADEDGPASFGCGG